MTCFSSALIPAYMLESLRLYVTDGIQPGHFLTAVLSNNLIEACKRADSTNLTLLPAYASYLYNDVPSSCWGSPEKVAAWLAQHAERRRLAETP